jgi:serine/threonine protein kinase
MKKIGRYAVIGVLGRGGMSTVYKVMAPEIDLTAALKCFDPSPALVEKMGHDALRRRFIAEAAVTAHIRHPNVLDVWRMEEADGRLFYLMPYFCRDLGALIGETYWADTPTRILRPERAVHYLAGVLEGLARLHEADIFHRDLKPANVMLTDQDTVIIADFGLSRARGETLAAGAGELVFGTKYYAAPEQVRDPDSVDGRADLYSAGVILYRMLTGRLSKTPPVRPGEINPDLADDWDDLILTALSPAPEKRYPDAGDMAAALEDARVRFEEKKARTCALGEGTSSRLNGIERGEIRTADRVSASFPADAAGGLNAEDSPITGTKKHIGPGSLSGDAISAVTVSPATVGSPGGLRASLAPRTQAMTIAGSRAKTIFGLDDLWRPMSYAAITFTPDGPDGVIVADPVCGLTWQQSGSLYPMTWEQAHAYAKRMNTERFGGIDTWGLPTVDELLTLLSSPPPGGDFCQAPVFDPRQNWIWSADRRSPKAAWYANMETGFVGSHDLTGYFYVRLRAGRGS